MATKIKNPNTLYEILGLDPKWYLQKPDESGAPSNKPRSLSFKQEQVPGLVQYPSLNSMSWSPDKPKYLYNTPIAPNKTYELGELLDTFNKEEVEGTEGVSKSLKLNQSSTIQSAMYFEEHELLYVSFKSGSSYEYRGVPKEIVEMFESAPSHGSFFYYNIRTTYSYHKV